MSQISYTQDNGPDSTPIYIYGTEGVTSVLVTQTEDGGVDQNVTIDDVAMSIASVTLNGLDGDTVTIGTPATLFGLPTPVLPPLPPPLAPLPSGPALTDLTLENVVNGSTIDIDNAGGTTTSLDLTTDNVAGTLVLADEGALTSLSLTMDPGLSFAPKLAKLTSERIAGSGVLTQTAAGLTDLETIIVSGAAGLADTDLAGLTHLTSLNASASSGPISVDLNDHLTRFAGGSGTDLVTVTADATVAIAAGSATNNEIVIDAAGAKLTAGGTYAHVTGFEILGTGAASSGTYNLGAFAKPISDVDIRATPASALTFDGAAITQTLSIDTGLGASGGVTLGQGAAAAGDSHDILNLILGTAATGGIDTSNAGASAEIGVITVTPPVSSAPDSTDTYVAGAPLEFTLQFQGVTSGSYFELNDILRGDTTTNSVKITAASSSTSAFAAAVAAGVNGDPALDLAATIDPSNSSQVDLVSTVLGGYIEGFGFVAYLVELQQEIQSLPSSLDPATGTLTITRTEAAASQVTIADGPNGDNVIGQVDVAPGASAATVAGQVETLLKSDGFTGVSLSGATLTYAYPDSAGPYPGALSATIAAAQADQISLAGVSVKPFTEFTETLAVGGGDYVFSVFNETSVAQLLNDLAGAINADAATTHVVASVLGSNLELTTAAGYASQTFTASQITEFSDDPVGLQAITANNYQTVNVTSQGDGAGANTTWLVDNALTTLVVSGPENLFLDTTGGAITSIDTTGAAGSLTLQALVSSEATTGLTVNLGDASVSMIGAASTGHTDHFVGGDGNDFIAGTANGGDTDLTLGNGADVVDLFSGNNVVSLGDHDGDSVVSSGAGVDIITLGDGIGDFVASIGSGADTITLGNGAGDTANLEAGVDTVTFGGPDAFLGLGLLIPAFSHPTETSISTSQLDVINGLTQAGDQIFLPRSGDTLATSASLADVAGEAVFAKGTYSASGHTFTAGASGHDALLTYDNGDGGFVSVVLVGAAGEIAGSSISYSTITLG